MIDYSIEYKSIVMRCDHINENAYIELDSNVVVEFYKEGMESVWAEVQKNAGEFQDKSNSEVQAFFLERYGKDRSELMKRCLFLKERNSNKYIGTCMAWYGRKAEERISILHWLAIDDAYAGKGYARMLITQILTLFTKLGEDKGIYLHTQPCSYRAIKLYNDFGFCMAKTDTYGTVVNEYEEAVCILQKCMTSASYMKLIETSVS